MPAVLPLRRLVSAAAVLRPRVDAAAVVLVGYLAAVAAAAGFVASYGPVLPVQDEWEYVPLLYHAGWGEKLSWAFARHNEHLYPLARLVWLALDAVSGHNFRAGMAASVGFLAAAAGLLIGAAARLRGRAAVSDVLFAALLLHAGHVENLTMGYQVCFTLLTLAVAGVLRAAAGDSPRATAAAALLVPVVAAGGGFGCAITLAVGPWAVWAAVTTRARWAAVPAAAAVVFAGWRLAVPALSPSPSPVSLFGVAGRVCEFLTLAGGGLFTYHSPVAVLVIVAPQLAAAVGLAAVVVRRPDERRTAGGLLSVLLGVWLAAGAVAVGRSTGWESRYTAVACLGPAVVLLAAARYLRAPALLRPVGDAAAVLAAVGLVVASWPLGKGYIEPYRVRYRALLADVRTGVPIDVLADRRVMFPMAFGRPNFVALWAAGFPLLKGVPPAPDWTVTPLPVSATVPEWMPHHGPAPAVELPHPAGTPVTAVRLTVRCETDVYWEEWLLEWTRPDGGRGEDRLIPWLVRGEQPLTFWVDGPAAGLRVRPVGPTKGLRVVRAEALTR